MADKSMCPLLHVEEIKEWLWNCPLPREMLRISLVLLKSNADRIRARTPLAEEDYSSIDEKVYKEACLAYRKRRKKGGK
jgi:hypothetical protein